MKWVSVVIHSSMYSALFILQNCYKNRFIKLKWKQSQKKSADYKNTDPPRAHRDRMKLLTRKEKKKHFVTKENQVTVAVVFGLR